MIIVEPLGVDDVLCCNLLQRYLSVAFLKDFDKYEVILFILTFGIKITSNLRI